MPVNASGAPVVPTRSSSQTAISDSHSPVSVEDSGSMLQLIADCAVDLLSVQDNYGDYLYLSPNSAQLFGWTPKDLYGRSAYLFVHADDARHVAEGWSGDQERRETRLRYRFQCRSGEYRWVESQSRMSEDWRYIVTTTRDIHQDVERLEKLERRASYDVLTNMLNRRALEEILNSELERSQRSSAVLSIAFFDVDHFKSINDTYGHDAGDRLLRDLSDCVDRNKRTHDVFGRWGGDEFLLLLPQTNALEAAIVVQRIRDAIARELPGITLSFGISSSADAGSTSDLLSHADAGVYRSKKLGGDHAIPWRADL